jgi:hypothetical protein
VRATIEKSFCSEHNDYAHHVVQDGLQLFDLQEKGNVAPGPESLGIMHSIIGKLSYEALQSVACIVCHNKFSFDSSRRLIEKMVKSHLPRYLTNSDNKDITSQLFNIFRNPCSYRSGSVSLVTPVSSELLSAINHALAGLDGMPTQVLLAMNRKIRKKSCTPKFGQVARFSKRGNVVNAVWRRCNMILTGLKEGNYLPKKLAKAISVMNLYQKQKSGSVDISQSEFFPFPKETLSKQNDILNAIWIVQKLRHDKLKLVRPILNQDSMVQKMHFKVALRNYLTECLFECDEVDLPDEALRAIAFINQISRHQFINRISRQQRAVFTEERMEAEVDAVLNLSSHLKALAHCCTSECSCDEILGNDTCNDGNDFMLLETNYLKLSPQQQQMPEPCCSNNISDSDVMRERFGGSNVGATHNVSRSEDPDSDSTELLKKPCERTEDPSGSGIKPDTMSGDANHLKKSKCSEINEICDETALLAHNLIGHMLDTWLFVEDNGLDEVIGDGLRGGLGSQGTL